MSDGNALAASWRAFFQAWPKELSQNGVLVTTFGEQIPYEAFMPGEAMVVVSRKTPDTVGARKAVIAYEFVAAVKIVDVVDGTPFESMGFTGKLPRK